MSFFTIIEIRLDEAGNTLERLPAWSFATRQEAVTRLNNLRSRHNPSGYDTEGDFWWGTAVNGDRMRFLIETKGGQAEGPTQLVDSSNVTTKEWGSVLEPILAEALKLAQADKGNI